MKFCVQLSHRHRLAVLRKHHDREVCLQFKPNIEMVSNTSFILKFCPVKLVGLKLVT
jgi:hypothetical protein